MPIRVLLALLSVQLLFAVHYVVAKWVLSILPVPAWVLLRVGGAAVLLSTVALLRGANFPRAPRTLAAIAGLSCFGVVFNQLLFNEGLSRTLPSHSALINCSIPVTTLLIAVLLRRERMSRRKAAALILTLGGVLLLLLEKGFDFSDQTVLGDLLCLSNATSFSIFLVLSRPLLRTLDAQAATALLFVFGSLGVLPYGIDELLAVPAASYSAGLIVAAVFIVVGPTAISYYLNNWALARVESSSVAIFIYLQFVLVAPLSALILQERLSPRLWPAALLVFAGLWLASRTKKKAGPVGPASREHVLQTDSLKS